MDRDNTKIAKQNSILFDKESKKEYISPELICWGSIEEITAGKQKGWIDGNFTGSGET